MASRYLKEMAVKAMPFPLIVVIAGVIGYLVSPSKGNHSATPLPSRWRQAGIATVVGLVLW